MYERCAQETAQLVTKRYSTSFGLATRLFAPEIRPHIYAIYGLTRLADEVVDTYQGADQEELLVALEAEVQAAMGRGGYSTNLIVAAFAMTARQYGIDTDLVGPFFASMRMDLRPAEYTAGRDYRRYVRGSAEVVGLMCLRVFVRGDEARYGGLEAGAAALGSAFQKVNFLRDLADDWRRLGRYYFPIGSFEAFDDATRDRIAAEIRGELAVARSAIAGLPPGARGAVRAAEVYYSRLLERLATTPAAEIRRQRVRVSDGEKVLLLTGVWLREWRRR